MHLPKSYSHSMQGLQKEGAPAVAATCFATPSATPAAPSSSLRIEERLGGSAPAVLHAVFQSWLHLFWHVAGHLRMLFSTYVVQHQGDWR